MSFINSFAFSSGPSLPPVSYPYALTLTNPGFELGNASGWTSYANSGPSANTIAGANLVNPRTGAYLGIASTTVQMPYWGQSVTLPAEVLGDVDAGRLIATASGYFHSFGSDTDRGTIVVECYDGSGVWLAEKVADFIDPSAWTLHQAQIWVPPLTRALRISVRGRRNSGTECSVYVDDFSLSLSSKAFVHRTLDRTSGSSTAGWTTSTGIPGSRAASYGINVFCGNNSGFCGAYKDVALPSDLNGAVDTSSATIRATYLLGDDVNGAPSDKARFWVECRDALGGAILGTLQSGATAVAATEALKGYDTSLAVPAGTRSFRLNWISEYVSGYFTLSSGYFARETLMIEA